MIFYSGFQSIKKIQGLNYGLLFGICVIVILAYSQKINFQIKPKLLPMKNLFCIIYTKPENFQTKAKAVHETWAKECDKYFFIAKLNNSLPTNVTHVHDEPFPILEPANYEKEQYETLTNKTFKTIMSVFQLYGDYDWYLKADDDTFIFVDNLKQFLERENSSLPVTFGYNIYINSAFVFHSGGAGYVLSQESLKRVATKLLSDFPFCIAEVGEDYDLGECANRLGIDPGVSTDFKNRERFHPYSVGAHLRDKPKLPEWMRMHTSTTRVGPECCSDTTISFHYMNPDDIHKLYGLWQQFRYKKAFHNFTEMLYQFTS